MSHKQLKKEDYILFILNHLEPERSDFWALNKIAFLVEFAFIYFKEKELSDATYAAINHGPVIDDYKDVFKDMEIKGLIKIDGFKIRLIDSKKPDISEEVSEVIVPLIKRYSQMTNGELKALTHSTDSYKITTHNELIMGQTIKKDLAHLETFFESDDINEDKDDSILVDIQRDKLIKI